MSCEPAREWLLNADYPEKLEAAPSDVAEHVRSCAACQGLSRDLIELERQWRGIPVSPRAEASKAAFLARLEKPPAPASAPPKPRRRAAFYYWSAAALLLIAAGSGVLFFGPGRNAEAHSDVIDQLVDWNLDLSEASAVDRQRIYSDRRNKLQKSIVNAKLDPTDRDLAENLMANGTWLVEHEDPVEELQRFNVMADQLLDQVKSSSVSNAVRADRFARQFRKVNERGIDSKMERIRAIAAADPERRKLVNRILKHDKERAVEIDEILERSPDITKKELRAALDLSQKRHKHKME